MSKDRPVNYLKNTNKLFIKVLCFPVAICIFFAQERIFAQPVLRILNEDSCFRVAVEDDKGNTIISPEEGLWSVSSGWENSWPVRWKNASPSEFLESGRWKILKGSLPFKNGEWMFRDAYTLENGLIKCIRRFEWKSEHPLDSVNFAVKWRIKTDHSEGFIPGLLYYGNPSEAENRPGWVPEFKGNPGEKVVVEEHRLPMPFICTENRNTGGIFGTSLHTLPSPVPGANKTDQWWSAGIIANDGTTDLVLLSGPVSYNGTDGIVKANQSKPLLYPNTWIRVDPGMIIEKTFFIDIYSLEREGTAFQSSIYKSLDLFKPYYKEDLPMFERIINDKYRFALSRWMEEENYSGFNMYPEFMEKMIVMGWCGQGASPGYALQVLSPLLKDTAIRTYVQKSLDHVSESPVTESGFPVRYSPAEDRWGSPDHVSQGQGLYNIGMAIRFAKSSGSYNTLKWEEFFRSACEVHASRIMEEEWVPKSTAEAFYIAPLTIAYKLYGDRGYREAAVKATEHFAERHLSMKEPYWGGTLDARGEDKEGALAAFQGFLYTYEMTGDEKYLGYAKHALDVCLSYVVVWDIPLPPGRMADHAFKTRGWTVVSPQNQHIDVFGVFYSPEVYKMGQILGDKRLMRLAEVMFRSCGQIIDPFGSQGEQMQQTNFGQYRNKDDVRYLRGNYSEPWTVFWITAHFLNAGARFIEMGVEL